MNNGDIGVKNLVPPNAYETDLTNAINFPKKILCLEAGQIEIFPIVGNSFIWTSEANQLVSVIHTKVRIISGQYISFFATPSGASRFEEVTPEEMHFIDEINNNYIDENNDYFKIR